MASLVEKRKIGSHVLIRGSSYPHKEHEFRVFSHVPGRMGPFCMFFIEDTYRAADHLHQSEGITQ